MGTVALEIMMIASCFDSGGFNLIDYYLLHLVVCSNFRLPSLTATWCAMIFFLIMYCYPERFVRIIVLTMWVVSYNYYS